MKSILILAWVVTTNKLKIEKERENERERER